METDSIQNVAIPKKGIYNFIYSVCYTRPKVFITSFKKINWKKVLKDQLFNKDESNARKSISIGLGVLVGIMPIWGLQTIVALVAAVFFKLNKLLAVTATHISFPLFMPFIIFLSLTIGKLWVAKANNIILSKSITLDMIKENLLQYIYCSITLAIIAGLIATGVSFIVLQVIRNRKQAETI